MKGKQLFLRINRFFHHFIDGLNSLRNIWVGEGKVTAFTFGKI